MYVVRFFFFFQAEDGIRDRDVTGVQTCALPISHLPQFFRQFNYVLITGELFVPPGTAGIGTYMRSEERRVGKECRSWLWPDTQKKKDCKTGSRASGRSQICTTEL